MRCCGPARALALANSLARSVAAVNSNRLSYPPTNDRLLVCGAGRAGITAGRALVGRDPDLLQQSGELVDLATAKRLGSR